MKRVFALIAAVGGLMFADLMCLMVVTRAFQPGKPPLWLVGIFYWPLAWPVALFAKLTDKGPSLVTMLLAGLLDFGVLYAFLSFIVRRWRRHPGAGTA